MSVIYLYVPGDHTTDADGDIASCSECLSHECHLSVCLVFYIPQWDIICQTMQAFQFVVALLGHWSSCLAVGYPSVVGCDGS